MAYEIRVREVGRQPVLGVRMAVRTLELVRFFDEATGEMRAYLARVGGQTAGPAMSLWHSAPGDIPDSFDIETCLPLAGPVESEGRMQFRELPAGLETYVVHHGAYDDMGQAFDALWQWIQEHGYEMAGPPRDVVLVGPNETSDPLAYRTEVVYPIVVRG